MSGPAPAPNWEASIRWQPVLNVTSEWIPSYAAMMLAGYGDRPTDGNASATLAQSPVTPHGTYGWGARVGNDGQLYWRVAKPNGRLYLDQAAEAVWFNGPNPIPPGCPGTGTQDFPCIGIHDARRNIVHPSTPLTTMPDSWALIAGGSMFTSQGHVSREVILGTETMANGLVTPSTRPWEHAVMVGRGRSRRGMAWNSGYTLPGTGSGVTQAAQLQFFCPAPVVWSNWAAQFHGMGAVRYLTPQETSGSSRMSFLQGSGAYRPPNGGEGVYLISFATTAWFDASVARDTSLVLTLSIHHPAVNPLTGDTLVDGNGEPTTYSASPSQFYSVMRTQQIESDHGYGYNIENVVAKENMAMTVPTYLPEFALVVMRNMSAHTVNFMHPMLGVTFVGRRDYFLAPATFDAGWQSTPAQ